MNPHTAFMAAVTFIVAFIPVLASDPLIPVVLKGHAKSVSTLAWAKDGTTLATASDDRSIRVWNTTSGEQSAAWEAIAREGYGGPVVAFTANLDVVAINYWGEITIRNMTDNKVIAKLDPILDRGKKSAFRPDVYALAFSPDGKRLATAGSVAAVGGRHGLPGGVVIIWDIKSGKTVHIFDKLSTAASSVTWSSDGQKLVAGTNGAGGELEEAGEVWVWDTATGNSLHSTSVKPQTEYGEWASVADVTLSPDGQRVAIPVTAGSRSASSGILIKNTGASIRVWDLGNAQDTQLVTGLKASVVRIMYSPNGEQLATASRDNIVRLWNASSGAELASLTCPDEVTSIAFSPNGRFLAAGSKDGSVRIWPAHSARQ